MPSLRSSLGTLGPSAVLWGFLVGGAAAWAGPPDQGAAAVADKGAGKAAGKGAEGDKADAKPAPAAFTDKVEGTDLTSEFTSLYERSGPATLPTAAQKELLRGYDVLLVPGFLTSLYMDIGHFVKETFAKRDVLDYLQDEKEALREMGVDTDQVLLDKKEFNTLGSVAENAERIVRAVEKSAYRHKRVILISHSKGGNDVLAALLLLQQKKSLGQVGGWLSVQGVLLGTPIADEIMKSDTLRKSAQVAIEKLGGKLASLGDITSDTSQRFIKEHEGEIGTLVKDLPIMSFASYKPKPADFSLLRPDSLLSTTRDLMADKGMVSDGLVPTKNAILARTFYIAQPGLDHAETAMNNQPPVQASHLDRKRFTRTLLSMMLDRIAAARRPGDKKLDVWKKHPKVKPKPRPQPKMG